MGNFMKKSQARGYLLEIVLSRLIEINGYDVIRVADGNEIVTKANGLNLRGRGGFHQFDTLGKFRTTPPFVYPLRLFVEAKFYSKTKVGIDRVRMGVGILEDVNTNYSTVEMNDEELAVEKYQYHYAIFSTSGFTEAAQRFAIAHKIHLIDLSGDEYRCIIDFIKQIVDKLGDIYGGGTDCIPNNIFLAFKDFFTNIILCEQNDINKYDQEIVFLVDELRREINNRFIYLATINSPHIIPLFSNNEFNEALRRNPHQNVAITWHENQPNQWNIISRNDIMIKFTLPNLLQKYMFSDVERVEENAICIKEHNIGKFVFIAYLDSLNPTLCTLKFDRNFTNQVI
jgi:hypothetical protein